MTPLEVLVFGTIAGGVLAWAAAEILASRLWWTAGVLLTVIHSAAAFIVYYGGSHAVAREATLRQTAALTGIPFGGGIYVNYLFLLVWTLDAAWWWYAPRTYHRRARWMSFAIRGFIFFIILNGAVLFADGWARVLGGVAVLSAGIGVWHQYDTSDIRRGDGVYPSDSRGGDGV